MWIRKFNYDNNFRQIISICKSERIIEIGQYLQKLSCSNEKGSSFYHATRMHSADYGVARCLSVGLSHAGIVCKRLHISSVFFTIA